MKRRTIFIVAAGLMCVVGLAATGYFAAHNADLAAARDGQSDEGDDDSSSLPIGAFVAIGVAILAAQQSKRKKNEDRHG